MIDLEAFIERAAIIEFCGGLSRFRAETIAAEAQGATRWQALREVQNAKRNGNLEVGGDCRPQMAWEQRPDDMPAMQPRAEEEIRPMPKCDEAGGRDGLELLALRPCGRGVL